METIEYEVVLGDQSKFTKEDSEIYVWSDLLGGLEVSIDEWIHMMKPNSGNSIIAMRRIIKTPVWTVADQKAGRLPEVGAKCHYCNDASASKTIIAVTKTHIVVDSETTISPNVLPHDYFFQYYKPIETPSERAQRLREEWKNNVIEIHHGKRRKMSTSTFLLDDIYDALLSGELPMPNKE